MKDNLQYSDFYNLYSLLKVYQIVSLIQNVNEINLYFFLIVINEFFDMYLYALMNNYIKLRIAIYLLFSLPNIYYIIKIFISLLMNKKIIIEEINEYIDKMTIDIENKIFFKGSIGLFDNLILTINKIMNDHSLKEKVENYVEK